MSEYYVGIDTSAYTTSLAVIDERDNIVLDLTLAWPFFVQSFVRAVKNQPTTAGVAGSASGSSP